MFSYNTTISPANAANTSFFEETQTISESLSTTLDFTGPLMDMAIQPGMYIYAVINVTSLQFFGVDMAGGQESVISDLDLTADLILDTQTLATLNFAGATTNLPTPLVRTARIDLSQFTDNPTLDLALNLNGSVTFRNALDTGSGFNLASLTANITFLASCPGAQICSLPNDSPFMSNNITRQLFINSINQETYTRSLILHALSLDLNASNTTMATHEDTYTVQFNDAAAPNIVLYFGLDLTQDQFITNNATVVSGNVTSNLYAVASDGITETLLATFTASAQAVDTNSLPLTNDFNVTFAVPFIETGIMPPTGLENFETERFAILVTPFLYANNLLTIRFRSTSTITYSVDTPVNSFIDHTTDRFGAEFRCGDNLS
jgi:hypothetical protein